MSVDREEANRWYDEERHAGGPVPEGAAYVLGYASDEGFGHHSVHAVWRLPDGSFFALDAGGCSCDYGTWDTGTYGTLREAVAALGNWYGGDKYVPDEARAIAEAEGWSL